MFFAAHSVTAIQTPERRRNRGRRCAEGLESGLFEKQRRRAIPRVRHDEPAFAGVKCGESFVELSLSHSYLLFRSIR
jgi:hypothetical protein